MGAKLLGNIDLFRRVSRALAQLPQAAARKIVDSARDTVAGAYRDQFVRTMDPYGKPWPEAREQYNWIHDRSGNLRNPSIFIDKDVIKIRPLKYGWIHHAGWVKATNGEGQNGSGREARELFPYRSGSFWWPRITDTVNDQMIRAMMKAARDSRGVVTRG